MEMQQEDTEKVLELNSAATHLPRDLRLNVTLRASGTSFANRNNKAAA
jgi:hypothetical protein